MVTVAGNKAGSPANPSWQKYGIQVMSGADQYAITGNVVVKYNAFSGISGTSGTTSQVIANNSQ